MSPLIITDLQQVTTNLNVALGVVVAVEYIRGGNMAYRDFIVGMLQRTLTAVDDHTCHTLWENS